MRKWQFCKYLILLSYEKYWRFFFWIEFIQHFINILDFDIYISTSDFNQLVFANLYILSQDYCLLIVLSFKDLGNKKLW